MKKGKLYIHIGTQKTGSTTLQSVLYNNRTELQREGIGYLGRFTKLSRKIRTIDRPDPELNRAFRKEIESEIAAFDGENIHSFVISNEKLSGDKMIGHKNAGAIAESLQTILAPLDLDVKLIVFIRRQDTYIESTYAQRVYSGSSDSFREFLDHFDESDFHWNAFLEAYSDVFGREHLIVQGFDRKYLPHNNSLVNYFGEVIGSRYLASFEDKAYKNRGFSREALEISRLTNEVLDRKEKRIFRDLLKQAMPKTGSLVFFTNEERRKFLDRYEASNRQVALEYFNDPWGELFSPPDYSRPDTVPSQDSLTPESVAATLSRLCIQLKTEMDTEIHKQKKARLSNKLYRVFKRLKRVFRM